MKALIYKDFISTKKSMGLMAIIMIAMGYYFHKENQLALLPFTFALIPTIFWGSSLVLTTLATMTNI